MFCRIQNLHISQTSHECNVCLVEFCRIQNLHISQTSSEPGVTVRLFCRIQNLHISQTVPLKKIPKVSFVEFKIYISLKLVALIVS